MLDIRQTKQYARYLLAQGWKVEKINNTYAYIKYIPIVGDIIKIQRPEFSSISQVS